MLNIGKDYRLLPLKNLRNWDVVFSHLFSFIYFAPALSGSLARGRYFLILILKILNETNKQKERSVESLLIESPQLPSPSVNPVINQGWSLGFTSVEKCKRFRLWSNEQDIVILFIVFLLFFIFYYHRPFTIAGRWNPLFQPGLLIAWQVCFLTLFFLSSFPIQIFQVG